MNANQIDNADDIDEINPNSWHYKLYKFNCQWIACWWGEPHYHKYPTHRRLLGLCPYMRTIFIWGPLIMLTNIIPGLSLYAAFIVMPSGGFGVGWFIGSVVLTVVALAGVLAMINWLVRLSSMQENRVSQLPEQAPGYKAPETFWTLVKSYLKSVKTKVCPVLRLPND